MIGDYRTYGRKLDHLTADLTDHLGFGKIGPAVPARRRHDCGHDHIGLAPLKVRSRRAGLFALSALGRSGLGAPLRSGLTRLHRISRRRFRRGARILLCLRCQVRDAVTQRFVLSNQPFVFGPQR